MAPDPSKAVAGRFIRAVRSRKLARAKEVLECNTGRLLRTFAARYYGVVTEAVLTDMARAMPALAENPIWCASRASMMIQN